ncbi:MAG: phenylacetate-CoA oxygenase subunit PaaJ [Burkholderiales bacterium]|nr:phenylacetate-CoA oxygenase subunit PaaJ [Burkholderiales bacterium]
MTTTQHQATTSASGNRLPDVGQIREWLQQVPDPEIPVISVIDLGIVRDIRWQENDEGATCIITITPTYSGCPAMQVIAEGIAEILHAHDIHLVQLETQLSPAWSTDWMSESGKQKLQGYGIAPPVQQVIDISGIRRHTISDPVVPCPQCGSLETRLVSQFGSTACKALYKCQSCLEPFDYFKCH